MRALIASDDASLSQQLGDLLVKLGHEVPPNGTASLDTAASHLRPLIAAGGRSSEIVFVVMPPSPERALDAIRELRRAAPKQLIAVGSMGDPRFLLQTLREGAQEYVDQANLSGELQAALNRLRGTGPTDQAETTTTALIGASGGSGCSTLAANAAVALAKAYGGCILLDLNAAAGDLSPLLDLRPKYTLADLCRSTSRLDKSLLEGALLSHSSGARLLAAPSSIADAKFVAVEGIRRVVSLAKELAPFVLADFGRLLNRDAAQALEDFDDIVLVLRLDFTSLRNARRFLTFLQELGVGSARTRIVANRYRQPGEIALQEASEALGMPISTLVSDDPKNINRANNDGSPVVLQMPSSRVAKEIQELAMSLHAPPGR